MKDLYSVLAKSLGGLVLLLFLSNGASAQTFMENFNGGIPGTWKDVNLDGLTPSPYLLSPIGLDFGTSGWIASEDSTGGDSMAVSTSWYSPAGASDDWLISPPIPIGNKDVLRWQILAPDGDFPDGYEVRISTGADTVPDFLGASNLLFSDAAAPQSWTWEAVNLAAAGFVNDTVYFAWRNNSNDQFLLYLDNVMVDTLPDHDGELTSAPYVIEYPQTPVRHTVPLTLSAEAENVGADTLFNVRLETTIDYNGSTVWTDTSMAVDTMPPAATGMFMASGSYTPGDTGFYEVFYNLISNDVDAIPANNMIADSFLVTDTTFSRDNIALTSTITGNFGIGGATPGTLGNNFTLTTPDAVTSVIVLQAGTQSVGRPISVSIYDTDTSGAPQTLIATCDTVLSTTTGTPEFHILGVKGGELSLAPGTYFFGVEEIDSFVSLAGASDNFYNNSTWVNFPGSPWGGWETNEFVAALLANPAFITTYAIWPNFNPDCIPMLITGDKINAGCGGTDGSAWVDVDGGAGGFSYLWSTGATTDSISGIAAGTYGITVTDSAGCADSASIAVSNVGGPSIDAELTSSPLCVGSADGEASLTVSGGTPPYSYMWEGGATGDTATGLAAGTYSVTVTDGLSCITIGSVTIVDPAALLIGVTPTNPTTDTTMDGSASASATGGTPPYSFSWSNGATGSAVTGLDTGSYSVTVTDGNGCEKSTTFTLIAPVNIDDEIEDVVSVNVFPNPSNGEFTMVVNPSNPGPIDLEIVDLNGRVIFRDTKKVSDMYTGMMKLSHLPGGTYFLKVRTQEGSKVEKIIIR